MLNVYRDTDYIKIRKIVNMALFISISIVLSVLESFIPISVAIPGVKLGLANIVLLMMIYHYSFKDLLVFQFIRITITSFILGLFSVYLFSMFAGIISLSVMYGLHKLFGKHIKIYSISIIGAITHNISQIIFAIFYVQSLTLILYIPILSIVGVFTGFAIAWIVDNKLDTIQRKLNDDSIKELFS